MENDLSQQQLADRLHVERSSLANWEAGRRLPDAAMISQIAQAAGSGGGAQTAAPSALSRRRVAVMEQLVRKTIIFANQQISQSPNLRTTGANTMDMMSTSRQRIPVGGSVIHSRTMFSPNNWSR